jgi:hypothetical protein
MTALALEPQFGSRGPNHRFRRNLAVRTHPGEGLESILLGRLGSAEPKSVCDPAPAFPT